MKTKNPQTRAWFLGALGLVMAASWVLIPGGSGQGLSLGGPRLVRIDSLPAIEFSSEMCAWMPAATTASPALFSMALQQRNETAVESREVLDRPPVRVIKDPFPTFSAVAVDMVNNEIVLQDENLFQIMAYDSSTNTPPTAALSEPKRVIGGHHTKMEFNCGLYIDPGNGDIYSVNNDTIDTMVIFSRDAKGDVPPTRELSTPHGTYGIAVDEAAEELFLSVQHASSVVIYNKDAEGDAAPIRMIVGNSTKMADPHGIALDTSRGELFVANYGNFSAYQPGLERGGGGGTGGAGRINGSGRFFPPSISVYPSRGDGDIPPLRVIQGPKTQLNWPGHIAVDEQRGELFVANDGGDSVLVFQVTDEGDVAPTRVITGARTQIKNPTGVTIDKKNQEVIVANMGNHRATVFPIDAAGNVPPLRVIRAAPAGQPALQIGNPGAVSYDTKRDEILVPN